MSGFVWTWPKRGSSNISTTLHFQTRKTINFAQISMYYNFLFTICDDMLLPVVPSIFNSDISCAQPPPFPEKK